MDNSPKQQLYNYIAAIIILSAGLIWWLGFSDSVPRKKTKIILCKALAKPEPGLKIKFQKIPPGQNILPIKILSTSTGKQYCQSQLTHIVPLYINLQQLNNIKHKTEISVSLVLLNTGISVGKSTRTIWLLSDEN